MLVLLGHTDVVPPVPLDAWTSDPFVPTVRDGVLYEGTGQTGRSTLRRVALETGEVLDRTDLPTHQG